MYNDFNSKKYILLLILICFIFTIFIIKAFDYLPKGDIPENPENTVENINSAAEEEDITVQEQKPAKPQPEQKHGVLYRSPESYSEEPGFVEIEAPKGAVDEDLGQISNDDSSQPSKDELALKSIINAKKFEKSGDLSSAINE